MTNAECRMAIMMTAGATRVATGRLRFTLFKSKRPEAPKSAPGLRMDIRHSSFEIRH
jgi:hypothetical protein